MAKMWEFDAFLEDGDEDFDSYVERFEHYCEVANVQEEKLKKSAFITAIGKNAYKTLKDLLLPATPAEKSLADLVKTGLLKKKELSFESACDFAKSVKNGGTGVEGGFDLAVERKPTSRR
ncbi:hypothetical protein MTO96_050453 [Rhipicephalus appendiculatus]